MAPIAVGKGVTPLRLALTLVAGITLALAIGYAMIGDRDASPSLFRSETSDFTPETVREFAGFPLYFVGTKFKNLPLTGIVRVFRKPLVKARAGFGVPGNRTNHMNFIYGTCGGGCAPPLTIQIWPACDRTLQDYYFNTPDGEPSRPYERMTIRGVPAALFSDMLEIYSGAVTIVIFGESAALRARAAESLASANTLAGDVTVSDPLPPPLAGAMEGKLHC